ncbi:MAG TPA: hypothetical protein VGY91_09850, partial [Chthoniobacterales bacterium]|nr:hypothetical protein [Chthoniobacterales bacterium]
RSITECNLIQFKAAVEELSKNMVKTEGYSKDKTGYDTVLESMQTALEFAEITNYEYQVAKDGEKVVGVLLMQKDQNRYMINDVISIAPGVGGALAKRGIDVARETFPNSEVALISETEKSTEFWLKHGFISNDPSKKRSVGMTLPPTKKD